MPLIATRQAATAAARATVREDDAFVLRWGEQMVRYVSTMGQQKRQISNWSRFSSTSPRAVAARASRSIRNGRGAALRQLSIDTSIVLTCWLVSQQNKSMVGRRVEARV
jgi:hypothetical protein